MNILITGAGSGIGKDTAIALAQNNHSVIAAVHHKNQLQQFADQDQITAIVCDITKETDRKKLQKFDVNILINNAGVGKSGPVVRVPIDTIRENYETNVFGTIAMIQQHVPKMMKQRKGRVIIVSSIGGVISLPYLGIYNSTKFALESIADSLRNELALFNIHVSVIEPGAIATGFNERMIDSKHDWIKTSDISKTELEDMHKQHQSLIAQQHDTQSIVAAIVHAVESDTPKTRYVEPARHYALLTFFASIIPDKLRDFILKKRAEV